MSAEARALASVLDVVEELALGLAHGQQPEVEWAQIVQDNFAKHRRDLRGEEVVWLVDDVSKHSAECVDHAHGPGGRCLR